MKGYNQMDPVMMQNAHVLGEPRMPTASEAKTMERNAITIAVMNIAGTALSSMLEYSDDPTNVQRVPCSINLAKAILDKSEATQNDYGEEVSKRKLRNQLAAQLIYSALRGGANPHPSELVDCSFDQASQILKEAEKYATEKTTDDDSPPPSSDTIELP